jgi:Prokaryotic E2 family E
MRRDFVLSDEDEESLRLAGTGWEAILDVGSNQKQNIVLIHGFPIHPGYNLREAILALILPGSYPDAQIDMMYFHPALNRVDGKSISALVNTSIDGKVFQRWSRHRTGVNAWRPGLDCIGTHILLVNEILAREFRIKP